MVGKVVVMLEAGSSSVGRQRVGRQRGGYASVRRAHWKRIEHHHTSSLQEHEAFMDDDEDYSL